jgi:two-component system sensor histidine kinase/response regulator
MVSTPARRDEVATQRRRRYSWLLAMVVAAGVAASLSIGYMLYRTAERQWIARAESDAQRLSSMLLGWMDESYTPLSGLAALVESSHQTEPEKFLNAFDGIESRAATVLLGEAAMLKQDAKGAWVLAISSGNFAFLERDASEGLTKLRPLIERATARPNQFVLGPPVSSGDERLISLVLIALANVRTPTVLVSWNTRTCRTRCAGRPPPGAFT